MPSLPTPTPSGVTAADVVRAGLQIGFDIYGRRLARQQRRRDRRARHAQVAADDAYAREIASIASPSGTYPRQVGGGGYWFQPEQDAARYTIDEGYNAEQSIYERNNPLQVSLWNLYHYGGSPAIPPSGAPYPSGYYTSQNIDYPGVPAGVVGPYPASSLGVPIEAQKRRRSTLQKLQMLEDRRVTPPRTFGGGLNSPVIVGSREDPQGARRPVFKTRPFMFSSATS